MEKGLFYEFFFVWVHVAIAPEMLVSTEDELVLSFRVFLEISHI